MTAGVLTIFVVESRVVRNSTVATCWGDKTKVEKGYGELELRLFEGHFFVGLGRNHHLRFELSHGQRSHEHRREPYCWSPLHDSARAGEPSRKQHLANRSRHVSR